MERFLNFVKLLGCVSTMKVGDIVTITTYDAFKLQEDGTLKIVSINPLTNQEIEKKG